MNQLKRLVYVHHVRAPDLSIDCWFNTAVLRVSVEVIKKAVHDPDWYFYFRLCVDFWKECYRSYRHFRLIAQANLVPALQSGILQTDAANAIIEDINGVGKHHSVPDEAIVSGLIDFDLATRTLEEA